MKDKVAFSIAEFCAAFGVSRSHYYKLLREGIAPPSVKLGRRRLIPAAAAALWLQGAGK